MSRIALRTIGLAVALFWCYPAFAIQPNIILMMADDMGMGDTSAYQDFTGNHDDVQVHTPNMERLARQGIRFTDAHTPSSRCSPTRYGLLTGRYPWRNRLKHWVLFGSQGDPMIEADRPTIASLLREAGYATGMVGKWHVGLRYRRSDGKPAAGWADADLKQPLHTGPVDHGFEFARFTSRSHGTSGPDPTVKKGKNRNGPKQNIGPGHIHERMAIGATGNGKSLVDSGPNAYVLKRLGSRHSDHAIDFLQTHIGGEKSKQRPFFLYYPANSNHGPYTPDTAIADHQVAGAARSISGQPMSKRYDFIYENDVALGRLLDWLSDTEDPRNPGKYLIETTLVIFTSDNGAEKDSDIATGPFRSHKGSVYEGGHRVPFIAAWPDGGIGDGDKSTNGQTNDSPIGLQDLYATFSEIAGVKLPDVRAGEKGGEDSFSVLSALKGATLKSRPPLFFNDHSQAKDDRAVVAMRLDSPQIGGKPYPGKWKLFFDAGLLRAGKANPFELYELSNDQWEANNLIDQRDLKPLIEHLTAVASLHRNSAGHRCAEIASPSHRLIDFRSSGELVSRLEGSNSIDHSLLIDSELIRMKITAAGSEEAKFNCDGSGLGISANGSRAVDRNEAILVQFDSDVIIESAALIAGKEGVCGGFYRLGNAAPLAVYCIDADNDAQDQSGVLSDIGVLKAGTTLRLDSSPHFGVEQPGVWRLQSIAIRLLR